MLYLIFNLFLKVIIYIVVFFYIPKSLILRTYFAFIELFWMNNDVEYLAYT